MIGHYQLTDEGLQIFGSREKFNRVLYGSHAQDDAKGRYFTFAGDTPIFMGAATDYEKNLFCHFAKNGVLMSGLALTPGCSVPLFCDDAADLSSRWFHQSEDILTTWHHGYMNYKLTQFTPWFPDVAVEIEVYPLLPEDGFYVHYRVRTDARIIFCAGFGGITDFFGRFEYQMNKDREYRAVDCNGNIIECGHNRGKISGPNGTALWIGTDFEADFRGGAAGDMAKPFPSMFLPGTGSDIIKLSAEIEAGSAWEGNIIVTRNADKLDHWLNMTDARGYLKEQIRAKHRNISMRTPNKHLNDMVPDLTIALDASWHGNTFYHGAMGYHAPFLGWRGWYAPSDIGWRERVRTAIRSHMATLITHADGPEKVWHDGADRPDLDHEGTQYHHLVNSTGRLTALLHRDDIYNMQEVAVSMTLHYLNRYADWELAAEIFGALDRILDWEERILDPDGDGLYQNFLNTWISDGHSYNGGGCAQASSYNYEANRLMVVIACKLGRDPAKFEQRARKIRTAIQEKLWLEDKGVLAEYIDTVGNCLVHPSPELSTIYLAIECGVVDELQAQRMLRFSEREIKSVYNGGRLSYSSNWKPKKYSTCGIFPAENACLALAYFQTGQREKGQEILDGLISAFYRSSSPGLIRHVVSAQGGDDFGDLDFTDVSSTVLRLIIEGLWGIRFQLLEDRILISPQLPPEWDEAELCLKDFRIAYRHGIFEIETSLGGEKIIRLPRSVKSVLLNGAKAEYSVMETVELPNEPPKETVKPLPPLDAKSETHLPLNFNCSLTEIHRQEYRSPRPAGYSIGVRLNGRYAWEWNHGGHNALIVDDAKLRDCGGTYRLKSGLTFATPSTGNNVLCVSMWDNFPTSVEIPLTGPAREIALALIGMTNAMQCAVPNAEISLIYEDGSRDTVELIHPDNFDDWLVPALQTQNESFYFSDYNHGMIQRLRVAPGKRLVALGLEAIANEVILGLLGITIRN